jgi:hypothetical protein
MSPGGTGSFDALDVAVASGEAVSAQVGRISFVKVHEGLTERDT